MDFMSFTKNLVKELGDGFQISDISNAVVKTLDGGDDEEPYVDPDGLAELAQETKEINGAEVDLHQDVEFCASRPTKVLGGDHGEDPDVEWLRPHDVCENPQFYTGGGSQFDVVQGQLGDCWLLAAMAPVSMNKVLLERICPNQSFDTEEGYNGRFMFRIFQYGEWVEVEIDDRLPCKNGKLMYTSSEANNEFWSALFEKAYAKVHGSYNGLAGGHASEAMTDLTGGVCEYIQWTEEDLSKEFVVQKYKELLAAIKDGAICTTAIQNSGESEREDGLIAGHAYSVTDARTVSVEGHRYHLLKLRNPWGQVEWNGDFSDSSELQVPDHEGNDDGEFWIKAADWGTRFTKMEICRLSTEDFNNNGHWHEESFHGKWSVEQGTAGGCRNNEGFTNNPYQVVSLSGGNDSDQVLVSLQQKHRRKQKAEGKGLLIMGFAVYKIVNPDGETLAEKIEWPNCRSVYSSSFVARRDYTVKFSVGEASGDFAIVPSTYHENEEGNFFMRVYVEQEVPDQDEDDFDGEDEDDNDEWSFFG